MESSSRPEKDFMLNFAKSAHGDLGELLALQRRDIYKPEAKYLGENIWEVKIYVSSGLASRLPFVPENVQAECAKKYEVEIAALENKFGHDRDNWPDNVEDYYSRDNAFVFFVKVEDIAESSIRFTMRFTYISPEFSAILRNYGEKFNDKKPPFEWTIGSYEQKLDNPYFVFLRAYIEAWAYSPDVWKTARDRRIENIAQDARDFMHDVVLENQPFNSHLACIPKKCFVWLCWDPLRLMETLFSNKELEEACGSMAMPVLMVKFETGNVGQGLKVIGYMPMPFDLSMFVDFEKYLKQHENCAILFETVIPEKEVSSEEEISRFIGKIGKKADPLGINIGDTIGAAYGIEP